MRCSTLYHGALVVTPPTPSRVAPRTLISPMIVRVSNVSDSASRKWIHAWWRYLGKVEFLVNRGLLMDERSKFKIHELQIYKVTRLSRKNTIPKEESSLEIQSCAGNVVAATRDSRYKSFNLLIFLSFFSCQQHSQETLVECVVVLYFALPNLPVSGTGQPLVATTDPKHPTLSLRKKETGIRPRTKEVASTRAHNGVGAKSTTGAQHCRV